LVEIELPSGNVMLAEVRDEGVGDVADRDRRFPLAAIGDSIGEVCHWALTSARKAMPDARKPNRIEVELGVKIAVKTGKIVTVLAEAGAEASIVFRMEWSEPSPDDTSLATANP
jgi:hypothetical protein